MTFSRSLLATAVLASCTLSGTVMARDIGNGPYAGLGLGGVWDLGYFKMRDSTDPGYRMEMRGTSGPMFSGALGYQLGPFRIEGELARRDSNADTLKGGGMNNSLSGRLVASSFMLNGYYSLDLQSNWRPFVTAGLGLVDFKMRHVRDGYGKRLSARDENLAQTALSTDKIKTQAATHSASSCPRPARQQESPWPPNPRGHGSRFDWRTW